MLWIATFTSCLAYISSITCRSATARPHRECERPDIAASAKHRAVVLANVLVSYSIQIEQPRRISLPDLVHKLPHHPEIENSGYACMHPCMCTRSWCNDCPYNTLPKPMRGEILRRSIKCSLNIFSYPMDRADKFVKMEPSQRVKSASDGRTK